MSFHVLPLEIVSVTGIQTRQKIPTTTSPIDDVRAWQLGSTWTRLLQAKSWPLVAGIEHIISTSWALTTLSVPKSLASNRMTNKPPPAHSESSYNYCWCMSESVVICWCSDLSESLPWHLACYCLVSGFSFFQHHLETSGVMAKPEMLLHDTPELDDFCSSDSPWMHQPSLFIVRVSFPVLKRCRWRCFWWQEGGNKRTHVQADNTLGVRTRARKGLIFVLSETSPPGPVRETGVSRFHMVWGAYVRKSSLETRSAFYVMSRGHYHFQLWWSPKCIRRPWPSHVQAGAWCEPFFSVAISKTLSSPGEAPKP